MGAIDLLLGNQQLLDAAACSYVQLLNAAGTLAASSSCTLSERSRSAHLVDVVELDLAFRVRPHRGVVEALDQQLPASDPQRRIRVDVA